MCDTTLPGLGGLRGLSDADLVAGIAGWSRASTVAEARKLAAIAEMKRRATERAVHPMGACDDTDAAAAELACALTVSHGRALGLMDTATTLRDRLPRLGARFLAGEVSAAVVSRIVWHTGFVRNAGVWAALDAELSERAAVWGVLSADKLEKAIEVWIDKYDPDAVRRLRSRVRGRSFTIGKRDDHTGTTAVYGSLSVADAAVLSERFAVMLAGLCEDDPRTMAQRRADAVGALGAGSFVLACRCDNPDCGARSVDDGRASSVVVHVFGEHASMDAPLDTELHGEEPPTPTSPVTPGAKPTTEPDTAHKPETDQKSQPASKRRIAGLIPGMRGAIVPAPLLADLIAHGAEVRFVGGPEDVKGVDGYRPSAAMDRFVRARDLTCRMPGCDRPAMHADIDHTVPYPYGPTHPSNTKCYCRIHHLLKTFWLGWSDCQEPDGTVHISTPTGRTYTTKPFATLLFPGWNTTTAPPEDRQRQRPPPASPWRGMKMPTRTRSREQARENRITRERRLNAIQRELDYAAAQAAAAERRARRQKGHRANEQQPTPPDYLDGLFHPPGYQPDYGDDPPPF
ncbi:MAG TPA: DUF222 domain-containing protein [Mycobacterium sp.]|nr:DUF222 domain-containing protein [Mycobacterium sp.]